MTIATVSGFERAFEAFAVLGASISFFSGGFGAAALVRYATSEELAESINAGIGFGFMVAAGPFVGLLVAALLGY
jgi:hypothetical protein